MSSIEADMAALKAEIAELQAERRAATTLDERRSLLDAITAKENRLTELIKLSAPARADPDTYHPIGRPEIFGAFAQDDLDRGFAHMVAIINPNTATARRGLLYDEKLVTNTHLLETIQRFSDELNARHDMFNLGSRKISATLTAIPAGSICCICHVRSDHSYRCGSCVCFVCVQCFPQTMSGRTSEDDGLISMTCPACRGIFFSVQNPTPDVSLNDDVP